MLDHKACDLTIPEVTTPFSINPYLILHIYKSNCCPLTSWMSFFWDTPFGASLSYGKVFK